jgi:hypothetical protein
VFIDRGVQFEGSCKMAPLEGDTSGDEATAARVAEDARAASEPKPEEEAASEQGASPLENEGDGGAEDGAGDGEDGAVEATDPDDGSEGDHAGNRDDA